MCIMLFQCCKNDDRTSAGSYLTVCTCKINKLMTSIDNDVGDEHDGNHDNDCDDILHMVLICTN